MTRVCNIIIIPLKFHANLFLKQNSVSDIAFGCGFFAGAFETKMYRVSSD